jgi:hypothetical protein
MPSINVTTATGDTTFTRSQEIILNAAISNDLRFLCPTAISFKFVWSFDLLAPGFVGAIPASVPTLSLNTRSLRLVKRVLMAFPLGSFNARVNVTMVHPDGELGNSAIQTINLISSGIVVRAYGGNSRSASTNSMLSLDSTFSIDQDGKIRELPKYLDI